MSIGDRFHRKMLQILLKGFWGMIKMDEKEHQLLQDSLKESAKPKMRGIKGFFCTGIEELKKDMKLKKE